MRLCIAISICELLHMSCQDADHVFPSPGVVMEATLCLCAAPPVKASGVPILRMQVCVSLRLVIHSQRPPQEVSLLFQYRPNNHFKQVPESKFELSRLRSRVSLFEYPSSPG